MGTHLEIQISVDRFKKKNVFQNSRNVILRNSNGYLRIFKIPSRETCVNLRIPEYSVTTRGNGGQSLISVHCIQIGLTCVCACVKKNSYYEATRSLVNTRSFKGETILSTYSQWKLADFTKIIIGEKSVNKGRIPYCVCAWKVLKKHAEHFRIPYYILRLLCLYNSI